MTHDQEAKLIELKALGTPNRTIAVNIGLDQSNVGRQSHKPTIRQRIKELQEKVITELSETAYNNIKRAIDYYKTPRSVTYYTDDKGKRHVLCVIDEQLKEHGFKSSLEVMRAGGALPSHNVSIVIQQTFNDNRTELPQVIRDILQAVTHKDLSCQNLLEGFESSTQAGRTQFNGASSEIIDAESVIPPPAPATPGHKASLSP